MKAKVYLQIAEPCHEDWNAMSPVQQGRYCGSCCKQVIDFSQMSDKEILQVLSKASGNTCGRFKTDQLQRPLLQEIPYSLRPYKFFAAALIPALVITGSAISQGRMVGKVAAQTSQNNALTTKGRPVFVQEAVNNLKGKITVENDRPAVGATVMIKGTKKGVATDAAGYFSIDKISAKAKITLQVSYVGFKTKEVRVDLAKQQQVNITLTEQHSTGEVVVVGGMISTIIIEDEGEFAAVEMPSRKVVITGKVVDALGQPLPYANITVSKDKKVVTSDSLGNFRCTAKRKEKFAELTASYAGYEPVNQTVSLEENEAAKVILTLSESKKLPDALVTAYATSCTSIRMGGLSVVRSVTPADTAKAMVSKVFKNEIFKVYPNPVLKGGELRLIFKDPGTYTIHLLDNSGKLYQSQNLTVKTPKQPVTIHIPGNLVPGNYFLKAVSKQTQKQFADKIIIQ